ncbi:hypothetical protein [Niabella soli]|uniref:Uncharacterized protein n=1 Tax=Niabella soli DSM 19437 TaxID=929713 RepID=W0F3H3_9BACT|nr:hypothetical protein [Niabella soli]AHF17590.1 hypothetical protein NIASO_10480 [Niabella soli DSM 19437]
MKKRLLTIVLLFFAVALTCYSGYSQNEKEIKLTSLKIISGDTLIQQPETAPLEAWLITDPKQSASTKGVRFSIKLVNHSASDIMANNVLERLSLTIYPDDPEALIPLDVSRNPRDFRPGQKWFLGKVPFEIGDVLVNGKKQNIDLTETQIITIPAAGAYTINLYAPTVCDKKLTKKEAFKRGRYRFALTMGLFSRACNNNQAWSSILLETPKMVIAYGR